MKRIYLLLFFLLKSIFSLAQDYPYKQQIIPPSPASAVFERYGDFQPSLSTGMIHIPIELYKLTVGEMSIPFILHYQTPGITNTSQPYPLGHG